MGKRREGRSACAVLASLKYFAVVVLTMHYRPGRLIGALAPVVAAGLLAGCAKNEPVYTQRRNPAGHMGRGHYATAEQLGVKPPYPAFSDSGLPNFEGRVWAGVTVDTTGKPLNVELFQTRFDSGMNPQALTDAQIDQYNRMISRSLQPVLGDTALRYLEEIVEPDSTTVVTIPYGKNRKKF